MSQFLELADPATLGWPPTLPLELAMGCRPPRDVCQAYGIAPAEYARLRADPAFRGAVERAWETLQEEGMSFKLKARAQAEELLKTSWALAQDPGTAPAVRADLIKFTIRAAGLDASVEQKARATAEAGAASAVALQINLHLGD